MSEHTHGDMDIKAHERTFEGFIRTVAWCGGISIAVLVLVALFNG